MMGPNNPQTVLVIDDSPDVHVLLKVRLACETLRLEGELTADAGLARARELSPDLILLDVDLDGVSGFELCLALKRDPVTQDIPVIFLTGAAATAAKVYGFELGAVDYVTKPFQAGELQARVRAALRTRQYQVLLATRAQVDGLTGLWNRRHFDDRMRQLVAEHDRSGHVFSLLMIDVDHFKRINDEFGHPVGDRALQLVAATLAERLRAPDLLCRYGGEEFAVLLPNTLLPQAVGLAERLRALIEGAALENAGVRIGLTASFGVACSAQVVDMGDGLAAQLLRVADEALYSAKRAGRNRVCVTG